MFKKIVYSFTLWRIALFFVAFLSIYLLPNFGARFPYADRVLEITHLPFWVWGFGNFDGVHYLRIAQDGYLAQYSQAFFPLFPILIRTFASIFPKDLTLNTAIYTDPAYFYSGFILSNLLFLGALLVLYKLLKLDFKKDIALMSIILLLAFPTSFYFGSVYTESLFLLLLASSVYLIRKEKFFLASIMIALATATRITGVLLIALYVLEAIKSRKKINVLWSLITPLGIIGYMYYLKIQFNDPFYFLSSQPVFGAGRSSTEIVLLPQVAYRYIKIFLTTNILSLPFFNAFLEFIFTFAPLTLLIMLFKKIRFSYWFFSLATLLLGTLTGTFSSMPRYALLSMVLIFPYIIVQYKKYFKIAIFVSSLLGVVLIMLFIRGYWVA